MAAVLAVATGRCSVAALPRTCGDTVQVSRADRRDGPPTGTGAGRNCHSHVTVTRHGRDQCLPNIPCASVARTSARYRRVNRTPDGLERAVEQAQNRISTTTSSGLKRRSRARLGGVARAPQAHRSAWPTSLYQTGVSFSSRYSSNASGMRIFPCPSSMGLFAEDEVDYHWAVERLTVETDGRSVHSTSHRLRAGPPARSRSRARGVGMSCRIRWRQVTECPERVAALLRSRLARLADAQAFQQALHALAHLLPRLG